MSKKIKLANLACPATPQNTIWDRCVLCQDIGGILIHPSSVGYETLANNLSEFDELNSLPLKIHLSRLNDGSGLKETLEKHSAMWHKKCYGLCNAAMLERARKRQLNESQTCMSKSPVKEHLQSDTNHSPFCKVRENAQVCFFCDESSGILHKVETIELDTRVRKIVSDLGDRQLLAKLSVGDLIAIDSVYHNNC